MMYQRDPEKVRAHYLRQRVELREMLQEAEAGREAAGMNADMITRIPIAHVVARRIWAGYPDRRTLTGRLLGDPIPERSAWWSKRMEAAE